MRDTLSSRLLWCVQHTRRLIQHVSAVLRAERNFKFKLSKERLNTALKLRIIRNCVCEIRAPYFLCFLCAKRSHEKVAPSVHRATAHTQVQLEVGNKSLDLVAGRLAKTRARRQLEKRIRVIVVLVDGELRQLRPDWQRGLSAHDERRSDLKCG